MIDAVTNSIKATNYLNTISIAFFESNEIVESIGSGVYKFTSKGRNFLKYYLNE